MASAQAKAPWNGWQISKCRYADAIDRFSDAPNRGSWGASAKALDYVHEGC
jgi:hypothetical protein